MAREPVKAVVGDWVRFYVTGRLVVGEVRYIQEHTWRERVLNTDVGSVSEDCVLEIRSLTHGA